MLLPCWHGEKKGEERGKKCHIMLWRSEFNLADGIWFGYLCLAYCMCIVLYVISAKACTSQTVSHTVRISILLSIVVNIKCTSVFLSVLHWPKPFLCCSLLISSLFSPSSLSSSSSLSIQLVWLQLVRLGTRLECKVTRSSGIEETEQNGIEMITRHKSVLLNNQYVATRPAELDQSKIISLSLKT